MMNIAIIGCGYVGYAIAQHWQQKKDFILTVTTTTPDHIPKLQAVAARVMVVRGNDLESLKAALKNQEVILLSVGAKSRNAYAETYLDTAKNLVAIIKNLPSVRQLIYTGTYSIYGDRNGVWVDEETPPAPPNLSAQILCKTEEVLLSLSNENIRVCILRLGGIYGPGRELVQIFKRVSGTNLPGNGDEITNWIHLDDIISAIEFARHRYLQGIYNLVADEHLTSRELIDRVMTTHDLPSVVWQVTGKSDRPFNVWVSNQKLKDAGYKLIHPQIIY